jgi:hypothetical protein
MSELFLRSCKLAVDTTEFKGHHITFHVEKTLKPDPNIAEIRIWNLTEDQRKQLAQATAPLVRLSAGYKDNLTQIFYGALIHVEHSVEGADVITTLSTGDGAEEYRKKRINLSFGPGTKTADVFKAIVKQLGLKSGNSSKFLLELQLSGSANIYAAGVSLAGSCAREMTELCNSAGLEWSIQDQTLQILARGKTLEGFAIVLNPGSGLIGSPVISNKGIVSGRALIVPDMIPGRQIEIKSRFVQGRYRLEKVTYDGDTAGGNWYGDFEAVGKVAA